MTCSLLLLFLQHSVFSTTEFHAIRPQPTWLLTHNGWITNEMQDEREKRVVCHVSLEHVWIGFCVYLCQCRRGKQRNHHLQGWRLVHNPKYNQNQLVISNQYFIILTHIAVSTLVLIVFVLLTQVSEHSAVEQSSFVGFIVGFLMN